MSNQFNSIDMKRRRFVQSLTLGGISAGLGLNPQLLFASQTRNIPMPVLEGTQFNLKIGEQAVNFTGSPGIATTVNGSLPAPLLRWKEGNTVTINVTNRLRESSSIHWHGIILPTAMDGVPGISKGFDGIASGDTFTYQFPIKQAGTYWYHSHSGFQEQTGLYGPIVIDPLEPEPFKYDREYVVMLSDWSDEDPAKIYAKLKKLSHYYNFSERTLGDFFDDASEQGFASAMNNSLMWNRMRMSQRDLSDVTGYTYTYLMNGVTPADGWVGLFKKGEKIRLRFINGSAMTFFDVRIPGLKMTVVAADGQYIKPVDIDEFRIGVAETYDVIVEPEDDKPYTLFAQSIDRSGYARGTLTPNPALRGEVPALDKVANLSHADMGMSMHHHGGHNMQHGDHTMEQGSRDMNTMEHGDHAMNHAMGHDDNRMAQNSPHDAMGHQDHQMNNGMNMSNDTMSHTGHNMDHGGHNMSGSHAIKMDGMTPNPSNFDNRPVHHADSEHGPHVDMLAEDPRYRLDDPGVGLRNNGRRVLTYADLRNLHPTHHDAEPDREIELHLTGNMGRYMWSINGIKHADAEPLHLKLGERVRITFVNDTMMNHPMHLHGMWSDVETGDNNYLPRKHTVIVQPGSRISYRVTVDAEGAWAYHCHLLYHMMGMFRTVVVS